MKLFVTGATGYIGKVVVEHAVGGGHSVEGLARNRVSGGKRVAVRHHASDRGSPIIATFGAAVAAPAADGGETDETVPIHEGLMLMQNRRRSTVCPPGSSGR